jgi:hypothetical protein
MRSKVLLVAATTAFMLSLATVGAKADTFQFVAVDDFGSGTNTVTFDLSSTPAAADVSSTGFAVKDVTVILNGKTFSNADTVLFKTATGNTEFVGDTDSLFSNTLGNILNTGAVFTGTTSDPTFVTGSFGTPGDSLTITDLTAAVPEPSTWAMMILGFCGLGFMAYRRKQSGSSFRLA